MVNVNMLKGKIVENGYSIDKMSKVLGIDKSTLYRKLSINGEAILIKEADCIAKALNLNKDEVNAIFFSQYVA